MKSHNRVKGRSPRSGPEWSAPTLRGCPALPRPSGCPPPPEAPWTCRKTFHALSTAFEKAIVGENS